MDSLFLRNIRILTCIGVPAEERKTAQELLVSLEFLNPIDVIARSDDPTDGIDYADVTNLVQTIAKTERKTIERFAEDVATAMLREFKPKGGIRVTVEKHPPLPLESASVRIERLLPHP